LVSLDRDIFATAYQTLMQLGMKMCYDAY